MKLPSPTWTSPSNINHPPTEKRKSTQCPDCNVGVAQDIIQSLTWRIGRHISRNDCFCDTIFTKMSLIFVKIFSCVLAWRHWNQSLNVLKNYSALRYFFSWYTKPSICATFFQEFSGKTSRHLTKSFSSSWLLCLDEDQCERCVKCLIVLKGEKEKKSAATTNYYLTLIYCSDKLFLKP